MEVSIAMIKGVGVCEMWARTNAKSLQRKIIGSLRESAKMLTWLSRQTPEAGQ